MNIRLHGFKKKKILFSAEEQIPPAGPLLTGTFSVFSLKHFNSTALHINLLIYLRCFSTIEHHFLRVLPETRPFTDNALLYSGCIYFTIR